MLKTKRDAKWPRYWPRHSSLAVWRSLMGRNEVEVHKNGKKRRPLHVQSFYQTSLVSKVLLYRKKNIFSCGIKQEITSRQDRFMLAKLGSQSERRIRFILPASHIITMLHKTEWSRETRTWSHKINRFHILATGCQRLFMHLLTKFNRCHMVKVN